MAFARKVWKLLVGIKDGLVLLFMLLFFGALFAALSYRPAPASFDKGAMIVALDGVVVEQPQPVDPFAAIVSGSVPVGEHRAGDVVRAIEGAAQDDGVAAVVLDLDRFMGGGQVHLSRIGEALEKVRAADKPVLAYASVYSDDAVQLAAHADEIWVDPLGGALLTGPGGSYLFFGDVIDRLKLDVNVYRAGTYKSAVEPFTRTGFSPEAREDLAGRVAELWETWKAEVSAARPAAQIDRISREPAVVVAESGGDFAKAAVAMGIADKIGNRAQFGDRVAEIVGDDPIDEAVPGGFAGSDYRDWLRANRAKTPGDAIGVITIAGNIVDGEAAAGTAGGATIARLLDDALDDDLKALVVRVDSPGGSVTASEEIRLAIARHKAKGIPVVVSMANYAASGGYWVSTPADTIFAEPATITGSIGVFAVVPTFQATLADWGIDSDNVRSTPLSGQPDLVGGFVPEVDALMQAGVDRAYALFLAHVGESRGIARDRLLQLAEGRVWTGGPARQVGLVDRFGDLDDALAHAAKQAGLEAGEWHAQYLAPEPSAFEQFVAGFVEGEPQDKASLFTHLARGKANLVATLDRDLGLILGEGGMQALCLECSVPVRAARPQRASLLERIAGVLFQTGER